jgi:5,10-methylenetetrahydromethanopterin reductase
VAELAEAPPPPRGTDCLSFCLNFLQDRPLSTVRTWWEACDAAGIDFVGVPDSPMIARELVVSAAYCAASTRTVGVMTAVTNPVSRDPSVLASSLLTLDELAPGRIACGIGTGDSALWSVGLRPARIAQLQAFVQALRGLLRGEQVEYRERTFAPAWQDWEPPARVPVYVACAGPKVLRMAAQTADGVIVFMGFAPENIALVRTTIEEGCAEVGRDPSELRVWWQTTVNFADTVEEAMERSLGVNTSWMTMRSLEGKQIPEEVVGKLVRFNADMEDVAAAYGDHDRGRVLVERAKEQGIYEWIVSRAPGFWGPPEVIAARLEEYADAGMTDWQFYVAPFHGDRVSFIESFTRGVLPRLATAG